MIRKEMSIEKYYKLKPVIFTDRYGKVYKHYRLVRVGRSYYTLAFLYNDEEVLQITHRGTAQTLDGKVIPLKRTY